MKYFFITLIYILVGCSSLQTQERAIHPTVFISDKRVEALKSRITHKDEPTYSAWIGIQRRCEDGLTHEPHPVEKWGIPGFYDNPDLHESMVAPLKDDSNLAYEEALCFRITGDQKYASEAERIISSWSRTLKSPDPTKADTMLSMSEFFSTMIVAADLLRMYPKWADKEQQNFGEFLHFVILPFNTMRIKNNNHGDWGIAPSPIDRGLSQ